MNIKEIILKFSKYSIVGVIGTIIHFGILTALVEFFWIDAVLSSAVGFIVTVVISYFLNQYWTFKSRNKILYSLPRYFIVSCSGLGINTAVMYTSVNIFHLWYIFGQALVILIIPFYNFILNLNWSFRESNF